MQNNVTEVFTDSWHQARAAYVVDRDGYMVDDTDHPTEWLELAYSRASKARTLQLKLSEKESSYLRFPRSSRTFRAAYSAVHQASALRPGIQV